MGSLIVSNQRRGQICDQAQDILFPQPQNCIEAAAKLTIEYFKDEDYERRSTLTQYLKNMISSKSSVFLEQYDRETILEKLQVQYQYFKINNDQFYVDLNVLQQEIFKKQAQTKLQNQQKQEKSVQSEGLKYSQNKDLLRQTQGVVFQQTQFPQKVQSEIQRETFRSQSSSKDYDMNIQQQNPSQAPYFTGQKPIPAIRQPGEKFSLQSRKKKSTVQTPQVAQSSVFVGIKGWEPKLNLESVTSNIERKQLEAIFQVYCAVRQDIKQILLPTLDRRVQESRLALPTFTLFLLTKSNPVTTNVIGSIATNFCIEYKDKVSENLKWFKVFRIQQVESEKQISCANNGLVNKAREYVDDCCNKNQYVFQLPYQSKVSKQILQHRDYHDLQKNNATNWDEVNQQWDLQQQTFEKWQSYQDQQSQEAKGLDGPGRWRSIYEFNETVTRNNNRDWFEQMGNSSRQYSQSQSNFPLRRNQSDFRHHVNYLANQIIQRPDQGSSTLRNGGQIVRDMSQTSSMQQDQTNQITHGRPPIDPVDLNPSHNNNTTQQNINRQSNQLTKMNPSIGRITTSYNEVVRYQIIDKADQCDNPIQHLKACAELGHVIGFDCEGDNLSRYGALTLIQMYASAQVDTDKILYEPCAYLFDVMGRQGKEIVKKLECIFEDPTIIKVIHDPRQDTAALLYQFNRIRIAGIWDTQATYGYYLRICRPYNTYMQSADKGMIFIDTKANCPDHTVHSITQQDQERRIRFNDLMDKIGLHENAHKSQFSNQYNQYNQQPVWKQRPLTEKMSKYAIEDVHQLPTSLKKLSSNIGQTQRNTALALSLMYANYYDDTKSNIIVSHLIPQIDGTYPRKEKQQNIQIFKKFSVNLNDHTYKNFPAGLFLKMIFNKQFEPVYVVPCIKAFVQDEINYNEMILHNNWNSSISIDEDEDIQLLFRLLPKQIRDKIQEFFDNSNRESQQQNDILSADDQGNNQSLKNTKNANYKDFVEVIVEEAQPVSLRFRNGTEVELPLIISISECLDQLEQLYDVEIKKPEMLTQKQSKYNQSSRNQDILGLQDNKEEVFDNKEQEQRFILNQENIQQMNELNNYQDINPNNEDCSEASLGHYTKRSNYSYTPNSISPEKKDTERDQQNNEDVQVETSKYSKNDAEQSPRQMESQNVENNNQQDQFDRGANRNYVNDLNALDFTSLHKDVQIQNFQNQQSSQTQNIVSPKNQKQINELSQQQIQQQGQQQKQKQGQQQVQSNQNQDDEDLIDLNTPVSSEHDLLKLDMDNNTLQNNQPQYTNRNSTGEQQISLEDTYKKQYRQFKKLFGSDNRFGVSGTLHRISAVQFNDKSVCGLTYRIGRHLKGAAFPIMDILSNLSLGERPLRGGQSKSQSTSLLVLGQPGVGKTTILRDIAYQLSVNFDRQGKVVVVDSSNEIAGGGKQPHPCIGSARRMSVKNKNKQHEVLKEAVQNHNPEVLIIDEISNKQEVDAIKSISSRGVIMIGTAHAFDLRQLLKNSELNGIVGGVRDVTLGDTTARLINKGCKTKLERAGSPIFKVLVEVSSQSEILIHMNVAQSVNDILQGKYPPCQKRIYKDGQIYVKYDNEQYKGVYSFQQNERQSKDSALCDDLVALYAMHRR